MHDEIINQAREILTQRLYRTDALASPRYRELSGNTAWRQGAGGVQRDIPRQPDTIRIKA